MAELLIKIGDNFPHKDLMLSLATTDVDAKQYWIERMAEMSLKETRDQRIAEATLTWQQKCKGGHRQGDIIKVRRNGWDWGNRESFPRFHIARIKDSELELLGYKFSEEKDQEQITELADGYFIDKFKEEYYHRHKFYLPDISGLKPDKIIEISPSLIIAKEKGYEAYDPAKASIHASAGTYTIKSSAGDYTDLSDWEAGEQCDLATGGGQGLCIAECYNDWSTGLEDNLVIDGWTVDSSNYVKVYAPSGQRHDGWTWTDTNKNVYSGFGIKETLANNNVIEVKEGYCVIDGIIIQQGRAGAYYGIIGSSGGGLDGSLLTIEHCIAFNSNGSPGGSIGFHISSSYLVAHWSNCIAYDFSGSQGAGFKPGATAKQHRIYNCTAEHCRSNFREGMANAQYKNCLGANTTYQDFYSITGSIDYCASEDASADDQGGSGNRINQTITFVDEANDDFHLASNDAGAKDYGTDLSGDAYAITDDIDYVARTGTWDIGADEYVAAGGIAPTGNLYGPLWGPLAGVI